MVCSKLHDCRERYTKVCPVVLPTDVELKVQLVLDASKLNDQIAIPEGQLPGVEQWARRFGILAMPYMLRVRGPKPSVISLLGRDI
jgi:hypothetical protein